MKKARFYLNTAAAALFAVAMSAGFQSCNVVDNPAEGGDDPVVVDPRVKTAEELQAAINAGDAVIELAANAKITLTEALQLPNAVSIVGDEKSPATIVLADGGIKIASSFALSNVAIDGANNTGALISISEEPTSELFSGTQDYYKVESIALDNVTATGITGSLVWDSNKKYGVVSLTINNCLIQLSTVAGNVKNAAIVSFQAGGVKDFAITNSTIYNTSETGAQYFLRYNNNGRIDRMGYDKATETQSWTYENNTFYKTISNDNGQWGNGPNGQNYFKYSVKNNIWVDCSNQIVRRLGNGRIATLAEYKVFENNTYWRNGENNVAAESASGYDESGTILSTDPAFVDAANGDFTPTGAEQVSLKTGDPRWLK